MARLIDADEAVINFGFEWDDIPPTREEFVYFLKKQPTINAVTVVRCRDCKHYNEGFCVGYHARHDIMPDDFCSYGERKDCGSDV